MQRIRLEYLQHPSRNERSIISIGEQRSDFKSIWESAYRIQVRVDKTYGNPPWAVPSALFLVEDGNKLNEDSTCDHG